MDTTRDMIARLRAQYGRPERQTALIDDSSTITRDRLGDALNARFGGRDVWVYIADFGDAWVVFEIESENSVEAGTWRCDYGLDEDGKIELGERQPVERHVVYRPVQRAFLSTVDDRTFLTAPVQLAKEQSSSPAQILWLQGRLVGGEKANRNGAMWTTADLEMGKPSVPNTPLNWLHEGRHIIGSVTAAELVVPSPLESASSGIAEPYIAATSGVWRWLWPDEARVIEQAAAQGSLWYSMECIAREIACVGDNGCGESYDYVQVMKYGSACQHILERSSTRRMVDPTFLGAAVIVPPVRPGWADADLELMSAAHDLAEVAHARVGDNGMNSTEWESLMVQVIAHARA